MKYLVIIFALFVGNAFSKDNSCFRIQDDLEKFQECLKESTLKKLVDATYFGQVLETRVSKQSEEELTAKKGDYLIAEQKSKNVIFFEVKSNNIDRNRKNNEGFYSGYDWYSDKEHPYSYAPSKKYWGIDIDDTDCISPRYTLKAKDPKSDRGIKPEIDYYLPKLMKREKVFARMCFKKNNQGEYIDFLENDVILKKAKIIGVNGNGFSTEVDIEVEKKALKRDYSISDLKFVQHRDNEIFFELRDSSTKFSIDLATIKNIYFKDFKVEIKSVSKDSIDYKISSYSEDARLADNKYAKKVFEDRLIAKEKEQEALLLAQQEAELARQQAERDAYFKELVTRCINFGFTGEDNIAACTQREANNDKQLALQQEQINLQTIAIEQNNLRIAKLEDANERYQEELLDKIDRLQVSSTTNRSTVKKADILVSIFSGITNAYFDAKQQAREEKRLRTIIRNEVRRNTPPPINSYIQYRN